MRKVIYVPLILVPNNFISQMREDSLHEWGQWVSKQTIPIQISKLSLTFHACLRQNLNCHQQEQVLEVYSYLAEVLEGISNFLALEVAYQSTRWTASFYNNANKAELYMNPWQDIKSQWFHYSKRANWLYIFTSWVKFPSSGGIGPDNWFFPKSNTLRDVNIPNSLGIIPMRLFPCKILKQQEPKDCYNHDVPVS